MGATKLRRVLAVTIITMATLFAGAIPAGAATATNSPAPPLQLSELTLASAKTATSHATQQEATLRPRWYVLSRHATYQECMEDRGTALQYDFVYQAFCEYENGQWVLYIYADLDRYSTNLDIVRRL